MRPASYSKGCQVPSSSKEAFFFFWQILKAVGLLDRGHGVRDLGLFLGGQNTQSMVKVLVGRHCVKPRTRHLLCACVDS